MSSTDVDPLDRFSAGLALAGSLIPAPGAAAAFMMSAATWTDQEERALSDPSGLWAIGVGVFLVLGVGFLIRADQVRERPRHPWQRLPGLDQGCIKHYAFRARVSPRVWTVAGRVIWTMTSLAVLAFVIGDLARVWV